MRKFSDFAKVCVPLEGDKLKIAEVLNKDIVVLSYQIKQSKKREGTQYITLQVEMDGKKYIVFTGSHVLISQAEEYSKHMPFETIIKKINDFYSFT